MIEGSRRAGMLLHPTSLPGPNGIGAFGPEAHRFIDWMKDAGQTVWQVMPLGPTGYGDSPYQTFSAFAMNPLFISLDKLADAGLLNPSDFQDLQSLPWEQVDFGKLIPRKNQLLRKAFAEFQLKSNPEQQRELDEFSARFPGWLEDYSLYMALKEVNEGKGWNDWPEPLRDRHDDALQRARKDLAERIEYHRWTQFMAITQWWEVRHHATESGIQVLGDLPIFIAYDSVDVWANRNLFHLDDEGRPTVVAGVPPDYFSETGQRWGNPLYNWPAHQEEGFAWWEARFRATFELVDIVRIDHFRGFEAYWEVPAHEETAVNGQWVDSPGYELFGAMRERMGELSLVAEDLGLITPEVVALRKHFGFPGMRVLQFAWDGGPANSFLPHHHTWDSVVYSGTHDNNTTVGWYQQEASPEAKEYLRRYIGREPRAIHHELIRLAYGSTGMMAIIPLQDWLGLGPDARMNKPGEPIGNWAWRVHPDRLNEGLAARMKDLAKVYGRDPESWE